MGDKAAAPPALSNTTEWMRSISETLKMLAIACFLSALWLTYINYNTATRSSGDQVFESKVKLISNFLAYRYMLGCAVIGVVFTILLFSLSISQLADPHQQRTLVQKYQLYNEIMLIVVASGGAASMGFTLELNRLQEDHLLHSKIVNSSTLESMYLITGTYLLGFLSNLVSSVLVRAFPL